MAILWQKTTNDHWEPTELFEVTRLSADAVEPVDEAGRRLLDSDTLILPWVGEDAESIWLILTPPAEPVLLNGQPLSTGIRVLADRDAMRLPGLPTRCARPGHDPGPIRARRSRAWCRPDTTFSRPGARDRLRSATAVRWRPAALRICTCGQSVISTDQPKTAR